MKAQKSILLGILAVLLCLSVMALFGCNDSGGPCSTGGNCRVDGISVSGNWCRESRCTVSKSGGNYTDYCDCK